VSEATVNQGPAVARGAVRDFQVSLFDGCCTALLPDGPNPEAAFRTIAGAFRGRNRCILPGILEVSREMCSFVVQRGTPPPVAGHPCVSIFKEIRRRPRDPPQSQQQLRSVRVTFLLPQKSPNGALVLRTIEAATWHRAPVTGASGLVLFDGALWRGPGEQSWFRRSFFASWRAVSAVP
jgi:hypothetical protein